MSTRGKKNNKREHIQVILPFVVKSFCLTYVVMVNEQTTKQQNLLVTYVVMINDKKNTQQNLLVTCVVMINEQKNTQQNQLVPTIQITRINLATYSHTIYDWQS